MNWVIIGLVLVGALVIGGIIGLIASKFSNKLKEAKLQKDAIKVIRGERDNKITLDDGRVLEVNEFTTFDEDGNKIKIDLKGGTKKKVKNDEIEEENHNTHRNIFKRGLKH